MCVCARVRMCSRFERLAFTPPPFRIFPFSVRKPLLFSVYFDKPQRLRVHRRPWEFDMASFYVVSLRLSLHKMPSDRQLASGGCTMAMRLIIIIRWTTRVRSVPSWHCGNFQVTSGILSFRFAKNSFGLVSWRLVTITCLIYARKQAYIIL